MGEVYMQSYKMNQHKLTSIFFLIFIFFPLFSNCCFMVISDWSHDGLTPFGSVNGVSSSQLLSLLLLRKQNFLLWIYLVLYHHLPVSLLALISAVKLDGRLSEISFGRFPYIAIQCTSWPSNISEVFAGFTCSLLDFSCKKDHDDSRKIISMR